MSGFHCKITHLVHCDVVRVLCDVPPVLFLHEEEPVRSLGPVVGHDVEDKVG